MKADSLRSTFIYVPFDVQAWRKGDNRPDEQELVSGSIKQKQYLNAIIDKLPCLPQVFQDEEEAGDAEVQTTDLQRFIDKVKNVTQLTDLTPAILN